MAVCIDCFAQIPNDTPQVSPLGARCPDCAERARMAAPPPPPPGAAVGAAPAGWAVPVSLVPPAPAWAGKNDMGRALVTGLAAAILGGGIWYGIVVVTDIRVGIAAIVVGFIVGIGVSFEQNGRDRVPLQVLSVVLTLLSLALAEYFIVRHAVVEVLASRGSTAHVPLFQSIDDMVEWVRLDIVDSPLLLLFWAIALFQAWTVPAGRRPFIGTRR